MPRIAATQAERELKSPGKGCLTMRQKCVEGAALWHASRWKSFSTPRFLLAVIRGF
jgi:hypothetical protein